MQAVKQSTHPTLASETFSHGRKHYFIDVKKAANDTHFLLITSSESFRNDPKYYRRTIQLWEEDLAMFVEALSMVLSRLAYRDMAPADSNQKAVKDPAGMKALAYEDRPRRSCMH